MIDAAGLIAAAALLATLVVLELHHAAQDTVQASRPSLLGRTVSPAAVAVLWGIFLVLFVPRVLGLIA